MLTEKKSTGKIRSNGDIQVVIELSFQEKQGGWVSLSKAVFRMLCLRIGVKIEGVDSKEGNPRME